MTEPATAPAMPTFDDDLVEIKDFTLPTKRLRFRVDNDVFEAHTILSLPLMQDLTSIGERMRSSESTEDKIKIVRETMSEVLVPESAQRFTERLLIKGEGGIDVMRQLMPIIHYILEQHGVRPTQPSPS